MLKKIGSVLLAIGLLLTAAGCNQSNKVTTTDSSGVTYFDGENTTQLKKETIAADVSAGILSIQYETVSETNATATLHLGMESSALTQALANNDCVREIGNRYIRYNCGSAFFYYTNDERNNGLASMVYYGTAYGFEPGITTKQNVQTVMGTPAVDAPATEDALAMFLYYAAGSSYLDYVCGNNHISFFFNDGGILSAIAVYQDGLWIY